MIILICSANQAVRSRWQALLADNPHTLYLADSVPELTRVLAIKEIELLLLHRSLIDKKTLVRIRNAAPATKIFLLSDRPNDDEGVAFLKLGVIGYGNTYIAPTRLNEAVDIVSFGAVWVGQKIMQRLIRDAASSSNSGQSQRADHLLRGLTAREQQIAKLVVQGLSNPEIARRLDIVERTVKAHLSAIYAKTGTNSRLNLALLLQRPGND